MRFNLLGNGADVGAPAPHSLQQVHRQVRQLVGLRQDGDTRLREDLVARQEMSRIVAEGMKLLPDEQRTAIVLKEYHGLTFQEIADLQGCPLSTVKTRLYRGLTVLRRHLESRGMTSFKSDKES